MRLQRGPEIFPRPHTVSKCQAIEAWQSPKHYILQSLLPGPAGFPLSPLSFLNLDSFPQSQTEEQRSLAYTTHPQALKTAWVPEGHLTHSCEVLVPWLPSNTCFFIPVRCEEKALTSKDGRQEWLFIALSLIATLYPKSTQWSLGYVSAILLPHSNISNKQNYGLIL